MKLRLPTLLAIAAIACLNTQGYSQDVLPLPSDKPGENPAPVVIDQAAEQAQQQLFKAAEQPSGPESKTTSTGRKATFAPAAKVDEPAAWKKDSVHKLAVMEVDVGGDVQTVMFELFPNDAPRTVVNFIENCESGAYNGLAFHRAIQNFIVQTGDPLTSDESSRDRWGTGGDAKSVPAEIKRTHRKGAVAMGRRADNVNPSYKSNGYQFYFALGNYGALDGKYTVFGQVVSGLDALERISRMPVDSNDCPLARIELKSLKVIDHKGPLITTNNETRSGRKYSKPAAAKGFFERALERVW